MHLSSYLRQPIYTMTIINENVFATGDDDGVVKCNNNLQYFLNF